MQFRFLRSDGLAQQGHFIIDHDSISTPQIIYTTTPNINSPTYASLLLKDNTKDHYHPIYTISSTKKNHEGKYQDIFTIDSPLFLPSILPNTIHETLGESYPLGNHRVYVLSGHLTGTLNYYSKQLQLVTISHASQLYLNPKDFTIYLHTLRSLIPPDTLVYLPAIANPQNLSVLIFLGVDLVDSAQSILAARNQILFFPKGNERLNTFETIPCYCPICTSLQQDPERFTFKDILFHNYFMMEQELIRINHAISTETLREHVLIRTSNSPHLTSIIRQSEYDPTGILEQKTPRYRQSILKATNIDTIHQPEVKRFQQTIINCYQKPQHTSLLLLLPCSAKKPYSFSKTHKHFQKAFQRIPNYHCIHELIITSPLGIVPRELELLYPASSYDIPVTHNWFDDELTMITTLLKKYLAHNNYQRIVCYLPEQLKSIIKSTFPEIITPEISISPTSQSDLDNVTNLLAELIEDHEHITSFQRRIDDMYCRAMVQFTPTIAEILLKDTQIKGKYPYLKIIDYQNTQLGMLTEKRGMISLTLQGAERIASEKKFHVHISTDFTIKGSIFAPGIIDVDPDIRKGDEVFVFQDESFQAVGVALMNGDEMSKRMHGKAVDIRHHR